MNRIQFFDSISGIQYPKMIVDFFDHFIALKQIVEDKGSITVDNNNDSSIEFSIIFKSNNDRDLALSNIQSGTIVIYNRPISVGIESLTDHAIKVILQ